MAGLVSIASAYTTNYDLLFAERVIVVIAGVSFVVGIQHVARGAPSSSRNVVVQPEQGVTTCNPVRLSRCKNRSRT
jgi:hypothetical protein